MPIQFQCSGCDYLIEVGTEFVGRKARCPQCRTISMIPSPAIPTVVPLEAITETPSKRTIPPLPQQSRQTGSRQKTKADLAPERSIVFSTVLVIFAVAGSGVLACGAVGCLVGLMKMTARAPQPIAAMPPVVIKQPAPAEWKAPPQEDINRPLEIPDPPREEKQPTEVPILDPPREEKKPVEDPIVFHDSPPPPPGGPRATEDRGQPLKSYNEEYVVPANMLRELPDWFPRKVALPAALKNQLEPNRHEGILAPGSPLWQKLEEKVQARAFRKSGLVSGKSGMIYVEDFPAKGGLLIGFFAAKTGYVPYVQPIFLTRDGEVAGRAYGYPTSNAVCFKAKSGYAVGGMYVHSGDLFNGLALTYMKIEETKLNRADWYQSEWVGAEGGYSGVVGHDGAFIVGVHSKLLEYNYITPRGAMTTIGSISLR